MDARDTCLDRSGIDGPTTLHRKRTKNALTGRQESTSHSKTRLDALIGASPASNGGVTTRTIGAYIEIKRAPRRYKTALGPKRMIFGIPYRTIEVVVVVT